MPVGYVGIGARKDVEQHIQDVEKLRSPPPGLKSEERKINK